MDAEVVGDFVFEFDGDDVWVAETDAETDAKLVADGVGESVGFLEKVFVTVCDDDVVIETLGEVVIEGLVELDIEAE